jgi:hypothetical protein
MLFVLLLLFCVRELTLSTCRSIYIYIFSYFAFEPFHCCTFELYLRINKLDPICNTPTPRIYVSLYKNVIFRSYWWRSRVVFLSTQRSNQSGSKKVLITAQSGCSSTQGFQGYSRHSISYRDPK